MNSSFIMLTTTKVLCKMNADYTVFTLSTCAICNLQLIFFLIYSILKQTKIGKSMPLDSFLFLIWYQARTFCYVTVTVLSNKYHKLHKLI